MQGMIERTITPLLLKHLSEMPAVALLGARQVGKTTLAKSLSQTMDTLYLDLESPSDLLKLSDPKSFFEMHADKLIILDEIQRMPDLFTVLRGVIDTNREQGRRTGQFLFLGSASMDLMRQSSESLAGRIRYLDMSGFNCIEVGASEDTQRTLLVRGGFPESYLAATDESAMDWLEDLIRTYLERDIPQMGFSIPSARLRRLWTMLAHLQGEVINASKIAANLEVDNKTVSWYIDILCDLLLVRRLNPYHANVKKRLVKKPRYYIRDTGIQHRLLGIESHQALLSNPVLGKSFEGFVIENIHSMIPRRSETYFYRTAAGAEIDLLIKLPSSELWAVEIKHGTAPKLNKAVFNRTCEEVGAAKKFVIYGGESVIPLGDDTLMLPLKGFLGSLARL